jgi:hypothetical protein
LTSRAGGGIVGPGVGGPPSAGPPGAGAAARDAGDGGFDARVPGVVFTLLVAACFVAFFLTQHLKHTPTALQQFKLTPVFSPTPSGHIKVESISFKLEQADEATVTIVDTSGSDVARLVHDHPVARYKQFSVRWNGRRGKAHRLASVAAPNGRLILTPILRGPPAPAGEYRVRVTLRHQHRSVLLPRSFMLVRP